MREQVSPVVNLLPDFDNLLSKYFYTIKQFILSAKYS